MVLDALRLAEAQTPIVGMGRVAAQLGDRDLERDGVGVEAGDAVDAGLGVERDHVRRVERAQAAEVEDRAQVDEERVVAGAGIDRPGAERAHACLGERGVVGVRPGADVGRNGGQAVAELRRGAVLDPGDRVGLADQEVVVGERRDRAVVVEERRDAVLARALLGLEPELVGHVVDGVAVVVDVDLVPDGGVELVEVRAAGGLLERDVVGDDRDLGRVVGADERVQVRVVGRRIAGDQGRLAVARRQGTAGRRDGDGQGPRECRGAGTGGHENSLV